MIAVAGSGCWITRVECSTIFSVNVTLPIEVGRFAGKLFYGLVVGPLDAVVIDGTYL